MKTVKILDLAAVEHIKKCRAEKKKYEEISEELFILGYARPSGKPYHAADVSKFACDNNLRTHKAWKKKKFKKPAHDIMTDFEGEEKIDNADLALRVMNSQKLSHKEKLKMLDQLI